MYRIPVFYNLAIIVLTKLNHLIDYLYICYVKYSLNIFLFIFLTINHICIINIEKKMLQNNLKPDQLEAGCDEAGRGCLAGPVFAAAVILPNDFDCDLLNDSKQVKEKDRYLLRFVIEEKSLAWAVGIVDHQKIDEINILNASFLAMHKAIDQLNIRPEHLLIDGNRFKKYKEIQHTCIVKGDSKFLSIAAASILAKTYRDDYMMELHDKYPLYGWNRNKGYPTKQHREAIKLHGITPYHRQSFSLYEKQLSLDFE